MHAVSQKGYDKRAGYTKLEKVQKPESAETPAYSLSFSTLLRIRGPGENTDHHGAASHIYRSGGRLRHPHVSATVGGLISRRSLD